MLIIQLPLFFFLGAMVLLYPKPAAIVAIVWLILVIAFK